MPLISVEWLNANEGRAYPLHDRAERIADGILMPNDIIADTQLWMPQSAGDAPFISSVYVSPALVCVTFAAAVGDPVCGGTAPTFVPLATIAVKNPVRYKPYPVTPIAEGVGGWVTFGSGASQRNVNLIFTSPSQGALTPRAFRVYPSLPVTGLGRVGVVSLRDIVKLQGTSGIISVTPATRVINNVERTVALIGLDTELNGTTTLLDYAGSCGHRPSAGTCDKTPITSINGVTPDCAGNIDVIFEGLEFTIGDTSDGLIIDSDVGLSDVCDPSPFRLVSDQTACDPNESSTSSTSGASSSSSSSSSSSGDPLPDAYCERFELEPSELSVLKGSFSLAVSASDPGLVWRSGASGGEQYAVDSLRTVDVNDGYTIEGVIRPFSGYYEGHLIFGYANANDFWYVGVAVSHQTYVNGCFFLGRRVAFPTAGGAPLGLGNPGSRYVFLSAGSVYEVTQPALLPLDITDYSVRANVVRIGPSVVVEWSVDWIDSDGFPQTTGTQSYAITVSSSLWVASRHDRGKLGLGVLTSRADFDNFGINCPGFSSSSSSSSSSGGP